MADRGVAPVAGKALEIAIVVLYVAMVSTALYGGAMPDYRTEAGTELGERTLAETARSVEAAVPTNRSAAGDLPADAAATRIEARVELPGRIRGAGYVIRAENGSTLVLDHPRAALDARVRLAVPGAATVTGEWSSGGRTVVRVRDGPNRTRVELITR